LRTLYQQIKRGTLSGLSIGGFFRRKATAAGTRIYNMDFTEISVTGIPVHAAPSFAVVEGKALMNAGELNAALNGYVKHRAVERDLEVAGLTVRVAADVLRARNLPAPRLLSPPS